MITQTYNLNMIPGGAPTRINVSQNDADSRTLTFLLYYGEHGSGPAFNIPAGAVVTIDGAKPDRKGFSYLCDYSGNIVTVNVTQQMTAVRGDVECQLTINKDGAVLGTANFLLIVERAPLPDGADMSETEIAAFTQLAGQAAESAQEAQQVLRDIEDAQDDLDASVMAANTTKTNLQSATDTANAAKTNLTNATSAANTARTNLTTATTNANTAKTNLTNATTTANAAKGDLETATTAAQGAKADLDTANQTAEDNLEALTNADKLAQKIPKVSPAVAGNLPVLTADGGLNDSGKAPDAFAPSGYGLGETSTTIPADLNDVIIGGIYRTSKTSANRPADYCTVICCPQLQIDTLQIAISAGLTIAMRFRNSGSWGDWEWVDPPLTQGVEYRTTERYEGKVVYVKLVDGGTPANAKTVSTGAPNPIRTAGHISGSQLPYSRYGESWYGQADVYKNNMTLRCSTDWAKSTYHWYQIIWYTKD